MSEPKKTPELLAEQIILDDDGVTWWQDNKRTTEEKIMEDLKTNSSNGATLTSRLSTKMTVRYGLLIGYKLVKGGLKYAQLRRFFDAMKELANIKNFEEREEKLFLFQIQLVNGLARQEQLKPFVKVLTGIISNEWIKSEPDFQRLLDFVDAIVAYFSYLGQTGEKDQTQEN